MFLGFVSGPVAGLLSGLIGATISDYFSYHQLFLNWDVAIGLMGLIMSVGYYRVRDRTEIRGFLALLGLAVVAVVLSVGFAVLIDIYQYNGQATAIEFIPPAVTYVANSLVLLPIAVAVYDELAK